MSICDQVERLIDIGVPRLAGCSDARLRSFADGLADEPGAVLVVHSKLVPAEALTGLLRRDGLPGFVVGDLADLADFAPLPALTVPDLPLYLIHDVDRGDDMLNWSPNDALLAMTDRGRTPLTIGEGISWLLQEPHRLERNRCFMTIGSRKPKGSALDSRTPAIWISNGTGRDDAASRGAPKVGWCWAGNRHTWLGFASSSHRTPWV